MSNLTGVEPKSPTPATLREFFFAQGESLVPSGTRDVLFFGNKTSSGSETADTLGDPLVDEADVIARFGRRSEVYAEYRAFNLIPQSATQFAIAVTESVGSAAVQPFTLGGTVGAGGSIEVKCHGVTFQVPIFASDADLDAIAVRLTAAINNADGGRLQVTAAVNGSTSEQVDVTAAQKGPRGDLIFGADATHGMRMKILGATAVTITKGSLTAGVTADDMTAALAAARAGEFYYQASSATAVASVAITDNGIGEASSYINTELAPLNGKQQTIHFGLVGTHAEAKALANSINLVTTFLWHAEASDWTPGMIAAHHMAIQRSKEVAHPGANFAGYTNGTGTPYFMPPAATAADVPTPTEIDQDLNNGISPIGFRGTARKPYIVRCVTNYHLNNTSQVDYRARCGHIPSVIFYCWETFRQRYNEQKQQFAGPDPRDNQPPVVNTTTPDSVRSIFRSIINDFIKPRPPGGFEGPILDAGDEQKMKDSINVSAIGGGFGGSVDWAPVLHNYHMRVKVRQIGAAY